jgi:DNA-binding NarL/FixJ family response regulator
MKIRLVLVDDHGLFLEGLSHLIKPIEDLTVVGVAQSKARLFALLERETVDLVVLDLFMPEPGLVVLDEMRRRGCEVRVLILTDYGDPHTMQKALQLGAAGFVLKTDPFCELVAAIRQVMQERLVYPQALMRGLQSPSHQLSPREAEVLNTLATGLTYSEIADKLSISRNTVGFHIKSIFTKLNVNNRTEATAWYFANRAAFASYSR